MWIIIISYLDCSHVSIEFQCIHTYVIVKFYLFTGLM